MKTNHLLKNLTFGLLLSGAAFITSCSSDNNETVKKDSDSYEWSTDRGLTACNNVVFENNVIGNGDDEFVFKGQQTIKKGTYLLKGWLYIANGSVLTIEPGTVIKGEKESKASIIVEPGGKLIAQGTQSSPIVFTSAQPQGHRKPGDWGGIVLCGNATNNQGEMQIEGGPRTKHGGSINDDNSGVLSYVRIEFAGYPFEANREINGLTLASVGKGTKIDHVQVSYTNDDSFEWFGGNVNCKYLIAYKGWDDDFDTDNGYSGNVQFGLAVRDPRIADASFSNGFESDNWKDGTNISPMTTATFSNMTFIGPKANDELFENTQEYINGGDYNPNNGSALGRFQSFMQARRYSNMSCFNSVAMGYPVGVIIENDKGDAQGSAERGELKLKNVWLANVDITGSDKNKSLTNVDLDNPTLESFSSRFFKSQPGNHEVSMGELELTREERLNIPCLPSADSPLIGAASFDDPFLNDFQAVNYVGAFDTNDNWLEGWTNFDPQNTAY